MPCKLLGEVALRSPTLHAGQGTKLRGDGAERPYLKSARVERSAAIKPWHPDHAGVAAGDLAHSHIERRERHGCEGNKGTFQHTQN